MKDIRKKEWINLNTKASAALKKIIEAEDILIELDDYQMNNGQSYPELEDMMLEMGIFRKKYTNYIENHIELLELDENDFEDSSKFNGPDL